MNPTQYMLDKDNTLHKHNEGTWIGSDSKYSSFNSSGVEIEVGEFLYAMVRLLKPLYVLETGTCEAISASYIGIALRENALGQLHTFEISPDYHKKATERLDTFRLRGYVTCYLQDVDEYKPSVQYELMFLDSEPERRFKEVVNFFPYLKQGGYIFVHDLPRTLCQGNVNPDHPNFKHWPFGEIPEQIKNWLKDDDLRMFHFDAQRSLTGFYRPHSTDYRWY